MIDKNPFHHRDIPTVPGAGDKSREFFVSRELAKQVIDVLPDAQWRLMFALARYGSLRCPSEVLLLRWGDIDWECGRMLVTSPKTEHHEGGKSRMIPIFPKLRPFLDECSGLAAGRVEFVITHYRKTDSNYGVLLGKLVRRAGIEMWAKPWQNLRSTCETELAERFPIHVVRAWLGNSQPVAVKHYLQLTDDHFDAASRNIVTSSAAVKPRNTLQKPASQHHQCEKTPTNAGVCDSVPESASELSGRYRTRTCDFHLVRVAL